MARVGGAQQWLCAAVAALAIHGLCFAIAARSTSHDIERGGGAPAQDAGSISLMASAVQASLFQTVEPTQSKSAETVEELDETQSETAPDAHEAVPEPSPVSPAAVATLKETARLEIDPISEAGVAIVPPDEPQIDPVERKPTVKPPQAKKAPVKKKRVKAKKAKPRAKPSSRVAAVRRGGGAQGRRSRISGTASLSSYMGRVRARVAGRARSPGGSGTVVVRFTVVASGAVAGARVVRGSSSRLNGAALRAVRGGFPPIPAGLPRRISFTLPIKFR